jgi:hypothetical protein
VLEARGAQRGTPSSRSRAAPRRCRARGRPFDPPWWTSACPTCRGWTSCRAREEGIDTLFIVMTAQNTMANAIEATKRGAYDTT